MPGFVCLTPRLFILLCLHILFGDSQGYHFLPPPLRSHLYQAQQEASKEAEQTATVEAEAREAIAEQKNRIVKEAEMTTEQQSAAASHMMRRLRVRLTELEGSNSKLRNEEMLSERDLLNLKRSLEAQAKATEHLRSSSAS